MSLNFTGREGCPHLGASASNLVLEKVLDALDESRKNLQDVQNIKDAAEEAKSGAVSAKDAAESASQNAQAAKSDAQAAKNDAETAKSEALEAKGAAETARDDAQAAKGDAETALSKALAAQGAAEAAKDSAQTAKTDVETAMGKALDAQVAAEAARSDAQAAKADAETAQGKAEASSDAAQTAKTDAVEAKGAAETARDAAQTAKSDAITARDEARDARDTAKQYSGKPAKAIDGTWWLWNAETGKYEDSGASSVLSIQHSYSSIEAMNADFANTSKNDMAIISSSVEEEDTAKLYINNGTEWVYLCDLSGVQGAKGDAATVAVGTVTVGAAGSEPSVTNVGTSAAAVLNFVIPKGDKGDTGTGISSITLTSGNHAPGTLDTYTVQLTNGETFTFQVYNGANGTGTGDLMADGSVPMTGNFNAGGHRVTNLAAPEADNDAVRKSDMDSLIITSETQPTSQSTGGIWYKVLS